MRPCDSCKECEMALVAYVRHKVKRKERGPSRLRNFSGHSDIDEHTQKYDSTTTHYDLQQISHKSLSVCACLLWESYALSGPTPMTTCQAFLPRVYPKLGHIDRKSHLP